MQDSRSAKDGLGQSVRSQKASGGDAGASAVDRLSRRRFMVSGCAAAGFLVAAKTAAESPAVRGPDHEVPLARYVPFAEPKVVYSRDGVLAVTLRVSEQAVRIQQADGVRTEITRTYNGQVPGPTLRLRAGECLQLELVNQLPPNPESGPKAAEHNRPGRFNTTNLHTHGLHVSPAGNSDNVFLEIEPGESQSYQICLPDFHAPGTHWYHAHRHGSTAVQMVNGLHGALIVEDPAAQQIAVDEEKTWIVQEIIGEAAEGVYSCQPPRVPFTVNGVHQPTFSMRPGEIQRWRFLLAGGTQRAFMKLKLVHAATGELVPMELIAIDGITFYGKSPQQTRGWEMAPGNRSDFLVQLAAGTYQVIKGALQEGDDQLLATVLVAGKPLPARPLPALPPITTRPAYLRPIIDQEIGDRPEREFEFSVDSSSGGCREQSPGAVVASRFLINGKQYGEPGTLTRVRLGSAEQWRLINTSHAEHPFHIHVNPFQVVDPDLPPEEWLWWDTIAIPAALSLATVGQLTIRQRFGTFTGKFVIHCHVLSHEDLGMMWDVEVVAADADAASEQV